MFPIGRPSDGSGRGGGVGTRVPSDHDTTPSITGPPRALAPAPLPTRATTSLVHFLIRRQCAWRSPEASSHALRVVERRALTLGLDTRTSGGRSPSTSHGGSSGPASGAARLLWSPVALPAGLAPQMVTGARGSQGASASRGAAARVVATCSADGALVAVGVPRGVVVARRPATAHPQPRMGGSGAGSLGCMGVVHDMGLGTVRAAQFSPRPSEPSALMVALSGAGAVDGTLVLGRVLRGEWAAMHGAAMHGAGVGAEGGGDLGSGPSVAATGGTALPLTPPLAWTQAASLACRGSGVWCAAWAPSGALVAVGCAGTLSCPSSLSCTVDAGTWAAVTNWRSATDVMAVGWGGSPNTSSLLFCGGRNGTVVAADVREGGSRQRASLAVGTLPTTIASIVGVPGSHLVVCGDVGSTAQAYDLRAVGHGPVGILAGYTNTHKAAAHLCCDVDGFLYAPVVVSGAKEGEGVRVWDSARWGAAVATLPSPDPVFASCLQADVSAPRLHLVTVGGIVSTTGRPCWAPSLG